MGEGTRKLTLTDIAPACRIDHGELYSLADYVRPGSVVADVGCGYGPNRALVRSLGAKWIGIEPFSDDPEIVKAAAEHLPFADGYFDLLVMDAVLEHIPDVSKAFSEVARVLKPGGRFLGYVAFMECFHEISYNHLSYKALEYYATANQLKLEAVSGGRRFGIDYHVARLIEPIIPFNSGFTRKVLRPAIAFLIKRQIGLLAFKRYAGNRIRRKMPRATASAEAGLYRAVTLLRFSNGFQFVIAKEA